VQWFVAECKLKSSFVVHTAYAAKLLFQEVGGDLPWVTVHSADQLHHICQKLAAMNIA
jgi:hypothetical protein